jgi:hypothetical protein
VIPANHPGLHTSCPGCGGTYYERRFDDVARPDRLCPSCTRPARRVTAEAAQAIRQPLAGGALVKFYSGPMPANCDEAVDDSRLLGSCVLTPLGPAVLFDSDELGGMK